MNKTQERILNDSAEVQAMSMKAYSALMQRFATYLESRSGYDTVAQLAERFSVRQGTIYTMCEDADAHDFWVNLSAWHQYPGDAIVQWGEWRHRQEPASQEPWPQPTTATCPNCYTEQLCRFDGEAYTCADAGACHQRIEDARREYFRTGIDRRPPANPEDAPF